MKKNQYTKYYHFGLLELIQDIKLIAPEIDFISTFKSQMRILGNSLKLRDNKGSQFDDDFNLLKSDVDFVVRHLLSPIELVLEAAASKYKKAAQLEDVMKLRTSDFKSYNTVLDRIKVIHKNLSRLFHFIGDDYNRSNESLNQNDPRELIHKVISSFESMREKVLKRMLTSAEFEQHINRIGVHGVGVGYRYLLPKIAEQFSYYFLSDSEKQKAAKIRQNIYGTRDVIQISKTHYKINPEAPPIEHAVDSFNKVLTQQGGTTATKLLIFSQLSKRLPVQASKSVEGEDFHRLLQHEPECVYAMSSYDFSAQFFTALLTACHDGKPDNFIAKVKRDSEGKIKAISLVGIDNDQAFGDAICVIKSNTSKDDKKHYNNLKNVFFLFPQMTQPLDSDFANMLLSKSPVKIMIAFLSNLMAQEKSYQALRNHFTQEEIEGLNIPLKFIPGTIPKIYGVLKLIYQLISKNKNITPKEILDKVYPLVGKTYDFVKERSNGTFDALRNGVYVQFYLEDVMTLSEQETQLLNTYQRSEPESMERHRTQSLKETIHEWLSGLSFSDMYDQSEERYLLESILSHFNFVKQLAFTSSAVLTDDMLSAFASRCDRVRSVYLNNCKYLTPNGIAKLLQLRPNVEVAVEEMAHWHPVDYLKVAQHCKQFVIILNNKRYTVGLDNSVLMKAAVQSKKSIIAAFLLIYGVNRSSEYKKSITQEAFDVMRLVIEACDADMLGVILALTPVISIGGVKQRKSEVANMRNHKGDSLLDYALSNLSKLESIEKATGKQMKDAAASLHQSVAMIVSKGGVTTHSRERVLACVLDVLEREPKSLELRSALINFCIKNNLFKLSYLPKVIAEAGPDLSVDLSRMYGIDDNLMGLLSKLKVSAVIMRHDQVVNLKLLKNGTYSDLDTLTYGNSMRVVIKTLGLRKAQVKPESDLVPLASSLSASAIETFELISAELTSEQFKSLFMMKGGKPRHCPSLKKLFLKGMDLNGSAMHILSEWLMKNTQIESIALEHCKINASSILMLGNALIKHRFLKFLSLQGNPIGDKGVVALVEILKSKVVFTHLVLNECGIGEKGLVALSGIIFRNKSLRILDLRYNHFGDRLSSRVLNVLFANTTLIVFPQGGNEFSKTAIETINGIIARNKLAYVQELSVKGYKQYEKQKVMKSIKQSEVKKEETVVYDSPVSQQVTTNDVKPQKKEMHSDAGLKNSMH